MYNIVYGDIGTGRTGHKVVLDQQKGLPEEKENNTYLS